MIIKQLIVGTMEVCCYIIVCEETRKAAIVDPGGNEAEILEECKGLGVEVKAIIATHAHPDHVCGNARLKKALGCDIIMHEEEAAFFFKPEVIQYFSILGLAASPVPDVTVKDGDVIEIGKVQLQVIHTPGHTPGGMCLYHPPDLFTGDTLFAGGVGRTDFPGGDTAKLLGAINNKLFVLPDETIVWPGHGYGGTRSTIGEEKRSNPFLTGGW